MRLLFLIQLLSVSLSAYTQNSDGEDHFKETDEWFEGSILLTNGNELNGLVRYNDQKAILTFKQGQNSQTFTETKVLSFDFFDERIAKKRKFYSLEYTDARNGIDRPMFFEALREYEAFAVLLRFNPVEVKQKKKSVDNPFTYDYSTGPTRQIRLDVTQVETIYLMNPDGDIDPYIEVSFTDKDSFAMSTVNARDTKVKSSMIDKDLLAQYVTEPIYDKLVTYANENSLKFKKKDDFMKILEYYDTLR